MRPAVTYTLYATSPIEQTGDVITFAQFEEGNILTETRNNAESCDESDSESLMMNEQDISSEDIHDALPISCTCRYALECFLSNTTSYEDITFLVLGTYTRYPF